MASNEWDRLHASLVITVSRLREATIETMIADTSELAAPIQRSLEQRLRKAASDVEECASIVGAIRTVERYAGKEE